MSVFADTPRWPQHGTRWGHLISDTSLEELHETAARAGLSPRSFDLDHYDWPVSARPRLVDAGVQFVGDGELTRILIASGLRIRLKDRPAARARRTAEHAAALGLRNIPRDLIVGEIGHADPLPPPARSAPGAFRMSREQVSAPPRIEAHDGPGRERALELLRMLDDLARRRGAPGFVGQVLADGAEQRR